MARSARPDAAGVVHGSGGQDVRIVSLVPSITELLFELGLGDRVVGRTTFCVHPRDALRSVPRVGGTKKPRLERIRELEPTHVIVNVDENRREDAEALHGLVPHVVVTHPLVPEDNLELYALLGEIFGREAEARALSARLSAELALTREAAARLPRREVLYLIWRAPWMTVSEPTYVSRMLALVGWQTVGHDPQVRYPEIDLASDAARRAELVLLSSEPFPFKEKHVPELQAALPGREVRLIDGEYVSWYGSRAIAGLCYLRRLAEAGVEPHAGAVHGTRR